MLPLLVRLLFIFKGGWQPSPFVLAGAERKPEHLRINWLLNHVNVTHSVKSVRIWSFSGPYFPAFRLNTEIYKVKLRIQTTCGKS